MGLKTKMKYLGGVAPKGLVLYAPYRQGYRKEISCNQLEEHHRFPG